MALICDYDDEDYVDDEGVMLIMALLIMMITMNTAMMIITKQGEASN